MDSLAPGTPHEFRPIDIELLNCLIAAPSQEIAAEWTDQSPTQLRRKLKALRMRFDVDTNAQLIVLATANGAVNPRKVLPVSTPITG